MPEGLKLPKWKGQVWPGYWYQKAASMLRDDLGTVKYETRDGVLDFSLTQGNGHHAMGEGGPTA